MWDAFVVIFALSVFAGTTIEIFRERRLRRWRHENQCEMAVANMVRLEQLRYIDPSAVVRSMTLLCDWLSPEQRSQFSRCEYFDVIGCDTGRRYRGGLRRRRRERRERRRR